MRATLCDPSFEALLAAEFELSELEAHRSTVVGLWPDYRIAYVNAAWSEFARENGGSTESPLGQSYVEPIAPPLVRFYTNIFARAATRKARTPTAHCYECSGPQVYREFAMMVYALKDSRGFVVVHSKVQERPHGGRTSAEARPERYVGADGLLHQCCHCRRMKQTEAGDWDWVPEWVAKAPKGTSHGLCPVCETYYYPA